MEAPEVVAFDAANARGMEVKQACLDASVSRLRPVLMTTLTTVLGMLPNN